MKKVCRASGPYFQIFDKSISPAQIPAMMVFSTNPGPSAHFFDIPGQMVDSEDIREIV
jgi:hypothetical protein